MIETPIRLTSGEEVKGFYLSEKDKEAFYENRSIILGFKHRIEHLENLTSILRRITKEKDILNYFKNEIQKTCPKDKSFHQTDITYKIESSGFHSTLRMAFESLVSEGIIEYRGSGWYRLKEIK